MSMICIAQHNHDTQPNNGNQPRKHVKQVSFCHNQQNPYNKLNKMNPTHIRIITYLKSHQQLKNQENKGSKHEILRENKKTHTFFLKIKVEMMKKNSGLWEKHGEFERDMNEQDNE